MRGMQQIPVYCVSSSYPFVKMTSPPIKVFHWCKMISPPIKTLSFVKMTSPLIKTLSFVKMTSPPKCNKT